MSSGFKALQLLMDMEMKLYIPYQRFKVYLQLPQILQLNISFYLMEFITQKGGQYATVRLISFQVDRDQLHSLLVQGRHMNMVQALQPMQQELFGYRQ